MGSGLEHGVVARGRPPLPSGEVGAAAPGEGLKIQHRGFLALSRPLGTLSLRERALTTVRFPNLARLRPGWVAYPGHASRTHLCETRGSSPRPQTTADRN